MKLLKSSNKIPVYIMIDDDVYIWASKWDWYAVPRGYARTLVNIKGKQCQLWLHRLIMYEPDNKVIDHIDHNILNCQRSNLRTCTVQQNLCNKTSSKAGTSKYLGVSYHKKTKRWRTRLKHNGIIKHESEHKTEIDAAKAYNKAAQIYHKEFANLNII